MPADLDSARYVSFTTHRRDGSAVSLPVWVVPFDGGYAFTTQSGSHKVRRLRSDARASLQVSDSRGRTKPSSDLHRGAAVVLTGDDVARVRALVKAKYRLGWTLLMVANRARRLVGGDPAPMADSAIKVTLTE